jgi:hypothetical protein
VDAEQGGVVAVRVGEEQRDLPGGELRLQGVELAPQVGLDLAVLLGVEEGGEVAGVTGGAVEALPALDLVPQPGGLLGQRPGAAGVVPESRIGDLPVELGETEPASLQVKGAPGAGSP